MKNFFYLLLLIDITAHALTLDEATKSAVENSHDLKILKLENQSVSWGEKKVLSGFLPRLQLDGRHLFNEQFEELEVPFGGQTFSMPAIQPYTSLGVTASLNIFNGFKSIYDLEATQLEKLASEYKLQRASEEKRIEIQTLFYRALGSQTLASVADETIRSLESHLSDVNSRIRSGVSTRYDLLRVEVQLEDAKANKVQADNSVVIARANLFDAIGTPDDGSALIGSLPDNFTKIELNKIEVQSENRLDRKAIIAQNDKLQSVVKSLRSQWMPAVTLFGNYEWYNNINHSISESDERFKSSYAVGFKLYWNLFDGGLDYANKKQAEINKLIAEQNIEKFDHKMIVKLEEAKRRFAYDVFNYNAKLSSIHKAEEAVRLAKAGLHAGARTNTEVLDAVLDLNRARATAIKSQEDALETLGQLELSVGHKL